MAKDDMKWKQKTPAQSHAQYRKTHPLKKIKCGICNTDFTVSRNNEKYCGEVCKKQAVSRDRGGTLYRFARTLKGQWKVLKEGARRRNITVRITFEEFCAIRSVGVCFYDSRHKLPETGCGIDRMDSAKDYSADNCVPCCPECNWMKNNTLSHGEMLLIMALRRFNCVF